MRVVLVHAFVALVAIASFASAQEVFPGEVHLALTHEPDQYRVTWTTFPKDRTKLVPGLLRFGPSSSQLSASRPSEPVSYNIGQMCGAPANDSAKWTDPGVSHTAVMAFPSEWKVVYYQVQDEDHRVSPVYMARVAQSNPNMYQFAGFGDMGIDAEAGNCTKILTNWTKSGLIDLAVHVGDVAYARGRNYVWRRFLQQVEPIASVVPYMVNCGNHDCLDPGQEFQPPWIGYFAAGGDGGECGVAYNARFFMPGQVDDGLPRGDPAAAAEAADVLGGYKNNIYYSFNHGPVHFVLASSEHDFREGSLQYKWLVKDLSSVDRAKTPWVFFGFHRPLYDVTICGELLPETTEMRKIIEPLLVKYKVNVVMHGHYHQYERTCPLAEDRCVDAEKGEHGPVYVTIGTAGKTTQCSWGVVPPWSLFLSYEYGVMRFAVHNRTHLTAYYHESKQSKILDQFTVTRRD